MAAPQTKRKWSHSRGRFFFSGAYSGGSFLEGSGGVAGVWGGKCAAKIESALLKKTTGATKMPSAHSGVTQSALGTNQGGLGQWRCSRARAPCQARFINQGRSFYQLARNHRVGGLPSSAARSGRPLTDFGLASWPKSRLVKTSKTQKPQKLLKYLWDQEKSCWEGPVWSYGFSSRSQNNFECEPALS
jgi:hypothetical protein